MTDDDWPHFDPMPSFDEFDVAAAMLIGDRHLSEIPWDEWVRWWEHGLDIDRQASRGMGPA